MLKIGSHVHFSKEQLLGSVEEAISYGASTFMFYTGAPQNTVRTNIDENLTEKAKSKMQEAGIDINFVVCHAPYIVNLANNKDREKYLFSIEFLTNEVKRCNELGVKSIVLHPGSAVGIERSQALKNIIYALNLILENAKDITICLETMAGKGTELGIDIEEIAAIIDGVANKETIGVCLDTCHLNDSGIDLNEFDDYLEKFDQRIGLDKIKVIHVNDSKNAIGSHKDRHENIGLGTIGFDTLLKIIYDERFSDVPKILETPYVSASEEQDKDRDFPPYRFEIEMIKQKIFDPNFISKIRDYYRK